MGFDLDKYREARERGPSVGEIWQKEEMQRKADEDRRLQDTLADANGVWLLADHYLPADVKEFGERHGIPELTNEMWRGAFIAGWRAAFRALKVKP
jgi:hypothetical protein